MIITRGYANRLVKQGKATLDGSTRERDQRYQIVVRHDFQRIDHYVLFYGQPTKLQAAEMEKQIQP